MEKPSVWTLLRGGETEQQAGLLQRQRAFTENPNGSNTMSLGIAYLWLHEYQSAWSHFRNALETRGAKGDVYFGMAGVAMWCLDRPSDAVAEWRAGVKANYARGGGLNITMPLLLFFASIIKPEVFEIRSAKELMVKKTNDTRIENWPGPIASWLLRQITEEEFQGHCNGTDAKNALNRKWLAEF